MALGEQIHKILSQNIFIWVDFIRTYNSVCGDVTYRYRSTAGNARITHQNLWFCNKNLPANRLKWLYFVDLMRSISHRIVEMELSKNDNEVVLTARFRYSFTFFSIRSRLMPFQMNLIYDGKSQFASERWALRIKLYLALQCLPKLIILNGTA